jgi:predicted PurR-regulated permease PerM
MFNQSNKNFGSIVDYVEKFFTSVIFPLIFGWALIFFLWNVYRFIKEAGNAEKRKDHQKAIMWSLVAMAAMFSVWALVGIVTGTFGVRNAIPQINEGYIESNTPRW